MASEKEMKAKAAAALEVVLAGYDANSAPMTSLTGVNPYYYSSDCWLMWEAGHWLQRSGMARPMRAKKSRGYVVKVSYNGAHWKELRLRDDGQKTNCNFNLI